MSNNATQTETPAVPSPSTSPGADSASYAVRSIIDPAAMDETLTVVSKKDEPADEVVEKQRDADALIVAIKSALNRRHDARSVVFEVGNLLIEAEQLKDKDYERIVKKSGLVSMSNANNYKRVARRGQLTRKTLQKRLPITVGALIDLVKWKEAELHAGVKAGVLHPDVTRGELRQWISEHRGKGNNTSSRKLVFEVYTQERDWKEEDTVAVEQALAQFGTRVHLVRPMTPDQKYWIAMGRWATKVNGHIVKSVRRLVTIYKKMQSKGWNKEWKTELKLAPDADVERIKWVLDFIGQPDRFETFRDNAIASVEQPEPPEDVDAVDPVEQFDEFKKQVQVLKNRRKEAKEQWDRAWAKDQGKLANAAIAARKAAEAQATASSPEI